MSKNTLKACSPGVKKAKIALINKKLTQTALAVQVDTSRQPVINFFKGRGVAQETFLAICEKLGLDWKEIADIADSNNSVTVSEEVNASIDILDQNVSNLTDSDNVLEEGSASVDTLVQEVIEKIKPYIQKRCSSVRCLDMSKPIDLRCIYTSVNIQDRITGRRRLEIGELLKKRDLEELNHIKLSNVTKERLSGCEAVQRYHKLMVLGKPGSGKTTFLKSLSLQCIDNNFHNSCVPILITLKEFAETHEQLNILEYVARELSFCGVTNTKVKLEQLLREGKLFLLLDGLDEVRQEHTKRVIKQIRDISDQFHTNQFVITCRIAANEYIFERFTEVELADFNEQQIAFFVKKWFSVQGNPTKAERFIQELKENKSIQELATSPLLLTLLCLVFGDKEKFPKKLSYLYQEAARLLLKKWDAQIFHEREQPSKNLSVKHKEDLLSQIAFNTFERGAYLFEQDVVEKDIADFIDCLRNIDPDAGCLRIDSETVLKLFEAQHGLLVEQAKGIYSFSHLTFQEYFVARQIKQKSDLEKLVGHITQKNWRQIFLLTVEMLTNPDNLLRLMKQQVNALLATDEDLLRFHSWVNEKSRSVKAPYQPATIRAFYSNIVHDLDHDLIYSLVFDRELDFTLAHDLVYSLAHNPQVDLKRDLNRAITFAYILNLKSDCDCTLVFAPCLNHDRDLDYYVLARVLGFDLALDLVLVRVLEITSYYVSDFDMTSHDISNTNYTLQLMLQKLKDQLPNLECHSEEYKQWWQKNGQFWIKQLRTVMIKYRNIGHDWQFSDSQKELLKQYYDANKLLANCLNSDCHVSCGVKNEIEDRLLLPIPL